MKMKLLAACILTALSSVSVAAPASKAGIAASSLDIYQFSDSASIQKLLSTQVKTADKKDLAIDVSMECSIGTYNMDYLNSWYGYSSALTSNYGEVYVWVEIDGQPIPVSTNAWDYGVSFCGNELHHFRDQWSADTDSLEFRVNADFGTHSFQWFAVNLPAGTHTVEVKASLFANSYGESYPYYGNFYADSYVAVGKRTMLVSPIQLGPKVVLP